MTENFGPRGRGREGGGSEFEEFPPVVYFYCYGGGSVGGEVVIFDILYIGLMPFDFDVWHLFLRPGLGSISFECVIEGSLEKGWLYRDVELDRVEVEDLGSFLLGGG